MKSNKEKPQRKIEEREIKVYDKNETKMGETRLRLVSWVINDVPMEAMFEKRSFVLRELKGETKLSMSKAKGFNKADVIWFKNNVDKVISDIEEFSETILKEQTDKAQNKEWSFEDEEKVAEEIFQ